MNVKRLQKELRELHKDPIPNCIASPLEENISQWRFIFKGADDTDYKGGLYMGSIVLPEQYPFAPPRISMITPNGRFKTDGKSICLSISDWHPESWNPAWGVRAIIIGLISFFYDSKDTAGAVKTTSIRKKELADRSILFNKQHPEYNILFHDNDIEKELTTNMKPIFTNKTVIIKRKRIINKK
jgi:ubiquitin-conjugating enzyme E2 J2